MEYAGRSGAAARDASRFELMLVNASRVALVFMGSVVLMVILVMGQAVLAPVALAVVIGLMFGPIADACERRGVPPELSAAVVVLALLGVIVLAIGVFAVPLSQWVGQAPEIWAKLQSRLASLKEPLDSFAALQAQVTSIFGGANAISVRVADGNTVTSLALIAPAVGAQVLLCLASIYFFVATRHRIQISLLSLCFSRRMRWRTAHIFGDIEDKVSRFLLSVTVLNFGVGVVTALAMWGLGMPSPILWGALAMALNYVPYIGQAVMVLVLLSVSLGTQSDWGPILAPVGAYLAIAFVEGQFVTPHVLGRTMTINPFLILLSTTYWLWAWGPVGGFISVPSLLILQSALSHIIPGKELVPRKRVRRTPSMTERDVVLANAAQAIKEKAEEEAKAAAEAEAAKSKEPPAEAKPAEAAPAAEPAAAAKPRRRRAARAPKPASA
jgi:predicted PurR-regulated permease PerM